MDKALYITTAIAYPNGRPHLGHALEIVQADVLARFYKLLGKKVFFQTGTDEHGVKNYQTAQKEGKDVLEFLDANVAVFKELYKELDIEYDHFIRTSDKNNHYPGAQKLWRALEKQGDIYKHRYTGLYCAGCESFKTERELEDGKCPNHPTRKIEKLEEENYFFKLSKYKDEVAKLIESDTFEVIPATRKNEILSWLKDAKDISFSRPKSSLPWGVPVPGDEEHVMYVWCDALSNYLTPHYTEDSKVWPPDIQVIGKDILRFHAAFWPAMLLSAKLSLPKKLFVHGFVLSKGTKMGKSTGNVIEPFDQIKKFGVDAFRFFLLESMPIDSDGEYSEELLIERLNTELVANISNFCYRTLSFLERNFEGKFSDVEEDATMHAEAIRLVESIKADYEACNFKQAIQHMLQLSSVGNRYLQDNAPWKLIKEDKERARRVLGNCVNLMRMLGVSLQPIMPSFAKRLKHQMAIQEWSFEDCAFTLKDHHIHESGMLFEKMEMPKVPTFALDLRVAKITDVKVHPDADKLYILQLDVGARKAQIVSGIRDHYTQEELLGKHIILVANLKPAKLRGVKSEGMLLACEEGDKLGLVVSDTAPGSAVGVLGLENNPERIKYEEFSKVKLEGKNGQAFANGNILEVDGKPVEVERVKNGAIH